MERPEKITSGVVAASIIIAQAPRRGREATLRALNGLIINAKLDHYSPEFTGVVWEMYRLYDKEGG